MSDGDVLFVYVVCANPEEARRIGRALVEERLAACVNIRPHESIYRWQGAVEQAEEAGMLVKTTAQMFAAVEERVKALHSYTLPCIAAWPVVQGLPDYLQWVRDSVQV